MLTKGAGSSFDITAAATPGVPFRPYFTDDPNHVKGVQEITFSDTRASLGSEEQMPDIDEHLDGRLDITTKRGRIIVASYMPEETTVHIVNTAGIVIQAYDIAPGEIVETRVPTGIYIVNRTKVSVK